MNRDVISIKSTLPQESGGNPAEDTLYLSIKTVIEDARKGVSRAVNSAMVKAYWNIGRLIVEEEQNGAGRVEYGSYLVKRLSKRLTANVGRGFCEQSLRNYRQFFQMFTIPSAVQSESGNGVVTGTQPVKGHTLCDDSKEGLMLFRNTFEYESRGIYFHTEKVPQCGTNPTEPLGYSSIQTCVR